MKFVDEAKIRVEAGDGGDKNLRDVFRVAGGIRGIRLAFVFLKQREAIVMTII